MKMTELFTAQLEREAPLSRRVLERVPEGRPDWKPHEKSMKLGDLATLVATMPGWFGWIVGQDELDLAPPGGGGFKLPTWAKIPELLKIHDDAVAPGLAALRQSSDEHLMTPWRLLTGGKVVMESPRYIVLADTFTHLAHHRGQLTVYLRLNGQPVPAVYGPSADEAHW